jgi:hypothetical protein
MEEKIEFMDMVIEQVKKVAKPGNMPMTYIKAKDGGLILGGIALDKKHQTCMALQVLKMQTDCKEMILVQEAWASEGDMPPSEDPKRRECFVVNYFSKDKCLVHMLEFERTRDKRELKWINESPYWKSDGCESRFNPFKFTEEDIEHFLELSTQDEIMERGKKEIIKLAFNFHMDIYRLNGKAFFQAYNGKEECFFSTKVVEDDKKFEQSMNEIKNMLSMVGGLSDK